MRSPLVATLAAVVTFTTTVNAQATHWTAIRRSTDPMTDRVFLSMDARSQEGTSTLEVWCAEKYVGVRLELANAIFNFTVTEGGRIIQVMTRFGREEASTEQWSVNEAGDYASDPSGAAKSWVELLASYRQLVMRWSTWPGHSLTGTWVFSAQDAAQVRTFLNRCR